MVQNVTQETVRSSLGVDLLNLIAEVIEQCCPLVTSFKFKIMKLNPRLAVLLLYITDNGVLKLTEAFNYHPVLYY